VTNWARVAQWFIDPRTWLRIGIIALFFLAEAFIGLAWRGILPLPLPPTALMLMPAAVCLVALFLLEFELGIALTILSFLFPLTVFSFGSFKFGVMPFLVLLLFVLYLVRGLVKEKRIGLDAPGALSLLLLVGVSLASVAYAYAVPDPNLARGKDWTQGHWWIGYQAMGIFMFAYTWIVYVVAANGLRSKTWLWVVYACAILVCAYIVVKPLPGHLSHLGDLAKTFTSGQRLMESASGSTAMLLALLTLPLILYLRRPAIRLLLGILFALALFNLLVSYFLNTWLGFLAGVTVIALKHSKKAFLLWLLILAITAVLASSFFLLIADQRFSDAGQGDLRRLDIWADLIRVWLKRPIVGVGNANLPSYFLVYGTGRIPVRVALLGQTHPHNTYLGILAENGLLGLGCVLWLIVAFGGGLWRSIDGMADEGLRGLAVGALALFAASATTAMFAQGLVPIYSAGGAGGENISGMAFMWIIYGLGLAATRVARCS
jgi:O-antigen ligase